MAEERIGFEDLFDPNFVQPAIDQLKRLLETIEQLEERIKSNLKPTLDELSKTLSQITTAQNLTASSVRNVSKATQDVAKSAAALDGVSKLKKRLAAQVEDLTLALEKEREEIKQLIVQQGNLKKSLRELTREGQKEAELQEAINKALKNNFESYTDLSEAYKVLADALQDLLASGQTGTEEFNKTVQALQKVEERLKAIDASVGRFQRNVGDYRRSILESLTLIAAGSDEAGRKVAGLAAIALEASVSAFRAAGGFKNFGAAIIAVGRSLRTVGIIAALEAILFLVQKIQEYFSLETRLRIEELKSRRDLLSAELIIEQRIVDLERARAEVEGNSIKAQRERALLTQRIVQEQRRLNDEQIKNIEALIRIREIERDNASKADERLQKETEIIELRKQLVSLTNRDRELAKQNRDIQAELVGLYDKARREALNLLPEVERAFLTRAEELRMEFEKVRQSIIDAQSEAERLLEGDPQGLAQLRARTRTLLAIAEANFRESRARILSELLGQLNSFFAQYTELSSEYAKIAAQADFEVRKEAIKQLERELIALDELTDQRLQLLNTLRELNLAQRDAAIFRAELRNLQNVLDVQKQVAEEQIRRIEEQKIIERRALRERLTDLEAIRKQEEVIEQNAQREVFRIRQQSLAEQLQSYEQFLEKLQQRRSQFTDVPSELDALIVQTSQKVDQIRGEIDELRLLAERTELEFETRLAERAQREAEARQRELEERVKKQAEEVKKQIEEIRKFSEQTLDVINKLAQRASERRREALEQEGRALDRTLDVLIARAQAGSLSAQESIAEVLEKQKELEARQRELRRQDQRRQLLLTALQAYTAAVTRGSQQPLFDTIRDLTALSQLVQALPTFYHGTEKVSADSALKIPNLARDAYIVRVHEGERIVPAHINKKLNNIPNEALPAAINTNISFEYDKFHDVIVYAIKKANKTIKKYDRL